ncbi:vitamin B12 ABC transporter, ATPase component BtuD [Halarchaeum acidiphilum MH1-52-1]|uniref:Cobalamin import ATP-binding protein BtuD n=1 Tax=Halarchaeum acidiphilum MH1-52-1 TaxID=1261545 RepID=U2YXU1_9EURY|nr:heme ABC transporter ATP-binding protein [Halarchaeum acidiphilum]GAD53870.1 vitamin B12 ABC transporter, ATPase component BtuD [Halarchaeum acidiphilum MH1-52-1]
MRANGLDVSLGGVGILDDVSLAVESGELVGLVGPNGAGKTTLLRTLAGYLTPDSGTVRVDGDDIHALGSKAASRRVAVVPQSSAFSFDFPVRDVVAMGRHPHRSRVRPGDDADGAARVERAIERCELAEFADRPVTALSGGERRRVLLARALAQDTPVTLLDEPTAGLDVNHQIRTLDLVRGLVDDGRRAVAAIHDLPLAARYCDRLVVLSDGRVHADGPPEKVVTSDTLRDAFDASAAVGTDPVTGTPAVTALTHPGDADAHVHVLGSGDAAVGLLEPLVEAGYRVTVGPVVDGSMDHEAARRLDCPAVTTPPFGGVEDDAVEAAAARCRDAETVVVPTSAEDAGANGRLASLAAACVTVPADASPTRIRTAVADAIGDTAAPAASGTKSE